MRAPTTGYWGVPTSSVDWCESNYQHSHYVCELFNTVSSLAMVLIGLLGLWLHKRTLEGRFLLTFFALAAVGVGSAAFHATLRFELQMLDELPMLWLALVMVFILLELRPGRRYGAWLPWALTAHGLLLTALAVLTRGRVQFWIFQLSFGSLELVCIYRLYRLRVESPSADAHGLFRLGLGSYLFAILLWFVDIRFCSFVSVTLRRFGLPNPQLHAVWHVLVSIGFYWLVVMIAYERLRGLQRSPELRRFAGIFPCVAPAATLARFD